MRQVLVDTNAYAAFKRGDERIVAVLQHAPSIIVCATVLGELLGGFAAGQRESANRAELATFLDSSRVKVVSSTQQQPIYMHWSMPRSVARASPSLPTTYGSPRAAWSTARPC